MENSLRDPAFFRGLDGNSSEPHTLCILGLLRHSAGLILILYKNSTIVNKASMMTSNVRNPYMDGAVDIATARGHVLPMNLELV